MKLVWVYWAIAVSRVHWNIQSHNLNLEVVFYFLVLAVHLFEKLFIFSYLFYCHCVIQNSFINHDLLQKTRPSYIWIKINETGQNFKIEINNYMPKWFLKAGKYKNCTFEAGWIQICRVVSKFSFIVECGLLIKKKIQKYLKKVFWKIFVKYIIT